MDLDQTQALDLGEYDDEIGSGSEENQNEAGLSKKLVSSLYFTSLDCIVRPIQIQYMFAQS